MQINSMILNRMKIFLTTCSSSVRTRKPMAQIEPVIKASILTRWKNMGSMSNLKIKIMKKSVK